MKEALMCISPIDGRYESKTEKLQKYFSEFGLIKYRVITEVHYFIALTTTLPELSELRNKSELLDSLQGIIKDFSLKDAQRVKDIEKEINHDVKAVEYFVKEKIEELGQGKYKEFVHFGLTSQDVTNTALPGMFKDALHLDIIPKIQNFLTEFEVLLSDCDVPMLAHTHGQPASPTNMKKELQVLFYRVYEQSRLLQEIPNKAKFGGASGNMNAHKVAYPKINWVTFANNFLAHSLGLEREQATTQISNYDFAAAQFHALIRINTILIDLCVDIWTYISKGYFLQVPKKGEVGSSAMPHKVNPIDFENAEGNLKIANALFRHLAEDLPVSRLQRDLCDSTVTRNIGVPMAHTLIALKSIIKGLGKIKINKKKIDADLEANWVVVSEAIQTILRREMYPQPYEALKDLTRGKDTIGKKEIHAFIASLNISEKVKNELRTITPWNYTGYAKD